MPSTKVAKQDFLDLFYSMYPDEYEAHWDEHMTTGELYTRLKDYEAECFQDVIHEYDGRYVS